MSRREVTVTPSVRTSAAVTVAAKSITIIPPTNAAGLQQIQYLYDDANNVLVYSRTVNGVATVYPVISSEVKVTTFTITQQTGQDWRYCRVDQLVFDKGQHVNFDALVAAVEWTREKVPNLGLVIDGE